MHMCSVFTSVLFPRDSQGDGKFMERHPGLTPYPRPIARPHDNIADPPTCHVTADVTGGEIADRAGTGNTNHDNGDNIGSGAGEHARNSATANGDVAPKFCLYPPDGSAIVQAGDKVKESAGKCDTTDDKSNNRGDYVTAAVTFSDKCCRGDSGQAPVKVWQRPPPGMDPFVILEKLML